MLIAMQSIRSFKSCLDEYYESFCAITNLFVFVVNAAGKNLLTF